MAPQPLSPAYKIAAAGATHIAVAFASFSPRISHAQPLSDALHLLLSMQKLACVQRDVATFALDSEDPFCSHTNDMCIQVIFAIFLCCL